MRIPTFSSPSLTVFVALVGVQLARAQTCLEANEAYPTGATPVDVACADFNADGLPDLVVAEQNTHSISVRLNAGAGRFGTSATWGTLLTPSSVTCGDFDGDGKQDVAACSLNGSILLILGTGTGNPASVLPFSGLNGSLGITSADFNGDGFRDIAVAAPFPGAVGVLLSTGSATFAPVTSYPAGANTNAVTAADFDGDGDFDLAASNVNSSDVTVFFNAGNGTFGSSITIATPQAQGRDITTADADNDGDRDIVIAPRGVIPNLGGGTFGPYQPLPTISGSPTHPTSSACADLDGDGRFDIVECSYDTKGVAVYKNVGPGLTFNVPVQFSSGPLPRSLTVADIDADGDLDVLTTGEGNAVYVLENLGLGVLEVSSTVGSGGSVAAVLHADMDFDGDQDLLCIRAMFLFSASSLTLEIRLQSGGVYGAPTSIPFSTMTPQTLPPGALAVGDFDGDGDKDVAAYVAGLQRLELFMKTPSTYSSVVGPLMGPVNGGLAVADIDTDGDLDFAVATNSGVQLAVNQGAWTFAVQSVPLGGAPRLDVELRDCDLDGRPELLAVSTQDVRVAPNLGGGAFGAGVSYFEGVSAQLFAITTADLDGDQLPEFIVSDRAADVCYWHKNQGGGVFGPALTLTVGDEPRDVAAHDVDGDGLLDVLCMNGAHTLSVLRNLGGGLIARQLQYVTDDSAQSFSCQDSDHDADGDIAVACKNGRIRFLRNCAATATPYQFCYGDGTGTACPCGGTSAGGRGCPNSANASGATLVATGNPSCTNDTLVLQASGVPSGPALFIQGTGRSGTTFGDGTLCVGSAIVRLGIGIATGNSSTLPSAFDPTPLHVSGLIPPAGGLRYFQAWYRDADPVFCSSATFNLTSAVRLNWNP